MELTIPPPTSRGARPLRDLTGGDLTGDLTRAGGVTVLVTAGQIRVVTVLVTAGRVGGVLEGGVWEALARGRHWHHLLRLTVLGLWVRVYRGTSL